MGCTAMTTKVNPPEEGSPRPDDRDGRDEPEYSYPALKLQQNGHVSYFTTIPIDDLIVANTRVAATINCVVLHCNLPPRC